MNTTTQTIVRNLKGVKQEDQYGCTFACLATITGLSYSTAKDIFHKNFNNDNYPKGKWSSLTPPMMLEALNDIFGIPCRVVKFISLDALRKNCILYVCPLEGCYDGVHVVVFDSNKRELFDPGELFCKSSEQLSDLEESNVISCVEIQ